MLSNAVGSNLSNRRQSTNFSWAVRRKYPTKVGTLTPLANTSMYRIKLVCVRLSTIVVLLFSIAGVSAAQEQPLRIKYWLGMSRPASHLFEVTIEVALPSDPNLRALDFQMPKWSPGRYAIFDFAKNVQEVKARPACPAGLDCTMPDAQVTRIDDQTWRVAIERNRHEGMSLMFSYKVFGNDLSGTFSQLDLHHANINGGCVFMYVVNHKQDPVALSIKPPNGWHIVNAETRKKDQTEFEFPNWDILIDTPTEIAPDWTIDAFVVDGKTYQVVVHSLGNEGGKRPALVKDLEKIVRTETAMWGPPEFDSLFLSFRERWSLERWDGAPDVHRSHRARCARRPGHL